MAVEPSRLKLVDANNPKIEIVEINYIPEYKKIDYELEDDKDREKYFKDIEKIVRGSYEYSELVKYLKDNMDMRKCSYFQAANANVYEKVAIHLHHSPITLYEMVITIFEKRCYYGESLDPEMVAKEVAYCHYSFLVGLIPLCETIHELVHNEYFFIPNDQVVGHYEQFILTYNLWIPRETKEKLQRIEEFTRTYNDASNKKILEPHYIYLDFAGTYKFPKLDEIMHVLDERMNFVKANGYNVKAMPLVTEFDENGKMLPWK